MMISLFILGEVLIVSNLLNFETNFANAQIIRLEQNYRSTKNILSCASTLIAKNKGRYGKRIMER